MKTIDDVIKETSGEYRLDLWVDERYEFNMSDSSQKIYRAFLKKELESRSFDLVTSKRGSEFSYLCAKLFLFSVMAKLTPVKEKYISTPVLLNNMKTLGSKGSVRECWQDERLFLVFDALIDCSKLSGLPNYTATIDELGRHPVIAKNWGGFVSYETNYTRRPNRNSATKPADRGYTVGHLSKPFSSRFMRD